MKILAIIAFTFLLPPLSSFAQEFQPRGQEEFQTGVDGLVIKKLTCGVTGSYEGTVSNRTDSKITGSLYLYSYDKAGDGIGQCHNKVSLDPKRGTGVRWLSCNCRGYTHVEIVVKYLRIGD